MSTILLACKKTESFDHSYLIFLHHGLRKISSPIRGMRGAASGRDNTKPVGDEYADYVFNVVDRLKRAGLT